MQDLIRHSCLFYSKVVVSCFFPLSLKDELVAWKYTYNQILLICKVSFSRHPPYAAAIPRRNTKLTALNKSLFLKKKKKIMRDKVTGAVLQDLIPSSLHKHTEQGQAPSAFK